MQHQRSISAVILLCLVLSVACKAAPAEAPRIIPVATSTQLATALSQARPGDRIVIEDGSYRDWNLTISRSGTAADRITICPRTGGAVILSGNSRMTIDGDYITVSGLCFKNGRTDGEIWHLSGSGNRITECAIIDYTDGGHKWIRMAYGSNNRLDHNAIMGKTEKDVTLQLDISESDKLNHHRIDHNYFGPRPRGRGNGWETIRNGYSHQQNNPAWNIFEYNLFHECDGENEIISSKSSHNTYRYNTFRNCAGELTLRHGKYNLVHGNFFFGEGKSGSAGIRIIGEGHRVVNNYIENTRGIGIQIYEGADDAQATGYQAANDILVAFNTVVNNAGNGVNVKDYPRTPRNIVIANNLLVGNARAVCDLSPRQLADSYSFHGNLTWDNPIAVALPPQAFRAVDPMLTRDPRGVLRPAPNSLVIAAAVSDYMDFGFNVDTDLDGQKRPTPKDTGADQVNAPGPAVNHPLDTTDIGKSIGPSWMSPTKGTDRFLAR